jgi:hypothetical protein
MEVGVQNLLNLFALANQAELALGIDWYPGARRRSVEIAEMYHIDLDTVIKVAAAISPKCPWENNMDSAEWCIRQYLSGCYVPEYESYVRNEVYLQNNPHADPAKRILAQDERISAPPQGGLKASVIKAFWILQGHDCLSGPKVNDFFQCIRDWENYLGACIDSHAIQGWFGSFDGGTYGIVPSFYLIVRADYIRAANLVGLSAMQFQAVLWLVKKRISKEQGRRSKAQMAAAVQPSSELDAELEQIVIDYESDEPGVRNAARRRLIARNNPS